MISLLQKQEEDAMSSSLDTAISAIDSQIMLYEDILNYISNSDTIIQAPYIHDLSLYDQYEQFTYNYDVFLNGLYSLHPEIEQITVYVSNNDLTHGKQFRPLTDLFNESWYNNNPITAFPKWFLLDDGSLMVIQKIPDPYVKYVKSFSDNCVCIKLSTTVFFKVLNNISTAYHLQIDSEYQNIYNYSSDFVANISYSPEHWTTIDNNLNNIPWKIKFSRPTQLVYSPVNHMALIIIGIIFICLVLTILISNYMSNVFVRRINILHCNMKKVKDGDLNIHVHDSSTDEIAELINNFQDMCDELNQLIQENYQKELAIRESQLKALQAQINPHFLYNCLSLMNSKALMTNQPEISKMSQLLSTFYRTTLNKGKSESTLKSEIQNIQSYIEIQQLLHDYCFEVIYQIDSHIPEILVPNLLLQPLVENSIIHGLLPKKSSHRTLFITITCLNDRIQFTVMDNGVGIPSEKINTLTQTSTKGYGLKNVHDRLILKYGSEYGLTIKSIPDESTMITFQIPLEES